MNLTGAALGPKVYTFNGLASKSLTSGTELALGGVICLSLWAGSSSVEPERL
jgi:hypothetical protein